MGIGAEVTVLHFTSDEGMPPYYAGVGDESATGSIVFYYYGHWSEFPRWQCLPVEAGRQAMRDFLFTGGLSKQLQWREG